MVAAVNGTPAEQQIDRTEPEPVKRAVPSSVSEFLKASVATEPFNNRGASDAAVKLIRSWSTRPEAGPQSNPNVGSKVAPVYGLALTPQNACVIVQGSITTENGWAFGGKPGVLKLEATVVVDWSNKLAVLNALRKARGDGEK